LSLTLTTDLATYDLENIPLWDEDTSLFDDNECPVDYFSCHPNKPPASLRTPRSQPAASQPTQAINDFNDVDFLYDDGMLLTPQSQVATPLQYGEDPSSPEVVDQQPTQKHKQKQQLKGKRSENGPERRTSHTEVERRYRDTLNDGLERLKQTLALGQSTDDGEPEYASSRRIPKAVVLSTAVHRIRTLERDRTRLAEQNAMLIAELRRLRGTTGVPHFLRRTE
jgi:hypothetical protein